MDQPMRQTKATALEEAINYLYDTRCDLNNLLLLIEGQEVVRLPDAKVDVDVPLKTVLAEAPERIRAISDEMGSIISQLKEILI